jgi:hypothetical protein
MRAALPAVAAQGAAPTGWWPQSRSTSRLAAGAYSRQTFSVNVRAEDHDDYDAPGKELNILISGAAPALHGLGYVAANIPTRFVVGDSTVCDAPSSLPTS